MGSRVQRFSISLGRGWVMLFLLVGALLLAAYWIGPLRPLPARLQLLAVSGSAALDTARSQPMRTADGSVVFPVALAVRNIGAETARPRRVAISVPAHFRLATTRGRLTGDVTPGLPMRRYVIELPTPSLPPDSNTQYLPGLDTLYLEPDLPRYYCTTQGLRVPEFTPAPRYDANTISNVALFYSFVDARSADRNTGIVTVSLDPSVLDVTPAPMPPTFRPVVEMPEARAPAVGPLSFAGVRRAHCGDPQQPIELYTVLWETREGGRVFVLYVDNIGRKRLYDLNRDGIIELETWDGDGDGRFETRRDARFAIPDFLMPIPPRDSSLTAPDHERPDSAWLALFHDYRDGPRRFAQSQLVAHPQLAVADTMVTDTVRTTAPTTTPSVDDLGPLRPADPQFLTLFADTAAGPFRFAPRRAPVAQQPGPTLPVRPTTPAAQPRTEPVQPAAEPAAEEPEPQPEPAPRPRPRKPPLGTPIRQ